ncbi:MAG: nitroreductase family protein [Lachnospiraceae bacterium]|nr:nitroreductase family protein [Lachnospiraceae bacterium]
MKKKSLTIAGMALAMALAASTAGYVCAEEATEAIEEENVDQEAVDSLASVVDMLVNDRTNWNFTDEAVDEEDLMTILTAGVNASSAVNEQPWVFSVITDQELMEELGVTSIAPVAIMISVDNSNEMKIVDAGLACQTMYITAKALGYGAKVESTAARVVRNDETGEYMERLGIPETMSARALLLIGYADEEADAVSTASERKDFDEVVVFVE